VPLDAAQGEKDEPADHDHRDGDDGDEVVDALSDGGPVQKRSGHIMNLLRGSSGGAAGKRLL